MKISARNILKGRVKRVKPGVVNTEVTVDLPSGIEIASVVTKESADNLAQGQAGLKRFGHSKGIVVLSLTSSLKYNVAQ